jgi:hypothetical protein
MLSIDLRMHDCDGDTRKSVSQSIARVKSFLRLFQRLFSGFSTSPLLSAFRVQIGRDFSILFPVGLLQSFHPRLFFDSFVLF